MKIKLNNIENCVSASELMALQSELKECNQLLYNKKGAGNDFLGWVELPSQITEGQINEINETAKKLAQKAEIVVVIGIGGSYLGAKAVLDALGNSFDHLRKNRETPIMLFAGQNLSEDYAHELIETLDGREVATIVISKSGSTTEPAIAFRIIKNYIEKRYGKAEAAERIVAVTDESCGALRTLATGEGYKTFVIPNDIGGRFSVMTPVGLLPLAVAGIDIAEFIKGAADMQRNTEVEVAMDSNLAMQYAAARTALYRAGKKIEILATYEPKLQNIGEWWKQLYGESEGKDGKGIFPASVVFTSDLHSMGQYIQDGERSLFETVLTVTKSKYSVVVEENEDNLDGLNYLAGKSLTQVNEQAKIGTMLAHVDGGVPNIEILLETIDAYNVGALLYMFEKACGISGYALGVNPFDQPGVEQYKANMFALLEKPGHEQATKEIKARL